MLRRDLAAELGYPPSSSLVAPPPPSPTSPVGSFLVWPLQLKLAEKVALLLDGMCGGRRGWGTALGRGRARTPGFTWWRVGIFGTGPPARFGSVAGTGPVWPWRPLREHIEPIRKAGRRLSFPRLQGRKAHGQLKRKEGPTDCMLGAPGPIHP